MRGMSQVATAVVIAASVLAAGCGLQSSTASGPAVAAPSARPQTTCVTPKLAAPGRTFTITDKDNGKVFCLVTGTGVFVFLHGTPARMWTHIRPDSTIIQPRPSGVMMLALGVTGGYFVATRFGQATLTSTRAPCVAGWGPPRRRPCLALRHPSSG